MNVTLKYGEDNQTNMSIENKAILTYDLKVKIVDLCKVPIDIVHIYKDKESKVFYMDNEIIDIFDGMEIQFKQLKNRCPVCLKKTAPIIGDCKFCKLKFCGAHRLPEAHCCYSMQKCRDQSFQQNEKKVLSEKCVATKV